MAADSVAHFLVQWPHYADTRAKLWGELCGIAAAATAFQQFSGTGTGSRHNVASVNDDAALTAAIRELVQKVCKTSWQIANGGSHSSLVLIKISACLHGVVCLSFFVTDVCLHTERCLLNATCGPLTRSKVLYPNLHELSCLTRGPFYMLQRLSAGKMPPSIRWAPACTPC